MQRITLIGNIGKDAELKEFSNSKFATFSLACTTRRKNGEEVKEITNWYDCSTDNIKLLDFLKQGTKVYLDGNFKLETYWSEKLNNWIPKLNIFAQTIELLSPKKDYKPAIEPNELREEKKDDLPF